MFAAADFLALLPWLILLAAAVLVLLLVAVRRRHGLQAGVTAASLVLCLAALPTAAAHAPRTVTALLVVDGFGLYYLGLLCVAALATCLMAYAYLDAVADHREEFYVLLLTATLGAATLVASTHVAAFFLGLELLSVSLFALVAYPAGQPHSQEAGIKYLVLAGLSSALLAFGLALLYYRTGSLEFSGLFQGNGSESWLFLAGNGLVLAGVAFKLSLAPFHFWAPDVYEGAPAPAAGYLATVSKAAVAALLLRYLGEARIEADPIVADQLAVLAFASIAAGNFLALLQDSLKRLLAYSSIAHLGYLLVAFIAGGPFGREAAAYYVAAYMAMNLGAFGVIAAFSAGRSEAGDIDRLEAYRGLFWTRPWLAGLLTVHLLSLAGIPLTAGFIAKFYLFASGVAASRWPLVAGLAAGSVVGLFYYLRVVIALYGDAPAGALPELPRPRPAAAWASAAVLAGLALAVVWFGAYPEPAMELARNAQIQAEPRTAVRPAGKLMAATRPGEVGN